MSRNLNCGCLCHGSNGNRIGDEYFSCKGCYGANHMSNLPNLHTPQPRQKTASKGPRKPRTLKPLPAKAVIAAANLIVDELMATAPAIERSKPIFDRKKTEQKA